MMEPLVIDCDAIPFIPHRWRIREDDQLSNRVRGSFAWGLSKTRLVLPEDLRSPVLHRGTDTRSLDCFKVFKELMSEPVLPANVLDYLLANSHLIPREWKGRFVFFWGTIYRNERDDQCVRCLDSGGRGWAYRCWSGLDTGGLPGGPALVLAG